MATQLTTRDASTTPHQRAARTTVARKVLMSITGLILVAFLLMHMFGNTKLLLPDDGKEFDEYSHYLRAFLYPVLPYKFFLWCFRIVLLACAIIHLWMAVRLTFRNRGATGKARYFKHRYLEGSFAARTMIWGGIIIVLGVICHLLQFTAEVITVNYPDGAATIEPHLRVVYGFQQWWLVLLYAIWMAAVCLHIGHGFYSALCTIGARTGAFSGKIFKVCSWIIAVLLFVGFMITPVLIFMGVIFGNV